MIIQLYQAHIKSQPKYFHKDTSNSTSAIAKKNDNVSIIKNDDFKDPDDKVEIITSILNDVYNLICSHIKESLTIDPLILYDAPMKKVSDKIYPTVLGILPYAKRKKFIVGDKMNIFDDKLFKWLSTPAVITDIRTETNNQFPNLSDKIYIVSYKNKLLKLKHRNLRRSDSNNDQVCRLKENGIYKVPIPYSFYGECSGELYTIYLSPRRLFQIR